MNRIAPSKRFFAASFATLAMVVGQAWAQTAPAPSTNSATSAAAAASPTSSQVSNASGSTDQEQVITLDPFTVTTENEGYQAVDTLGGARVETKLADTPSALSVVTKKFLEDTGITDAQGLLVYTTDTEVAGLNGNYSGVSSRGSGVQSNAEAGRLLNPDMTNRARGISPMDNTRNYFESEIPWDSFDISRVDISRGPNSFLFGVGSPSGISNYSTNEAVFKDQGSLEARYGSYGSTREALDYNKVILPEELAFRIDLLNNDTEYRQQPAFNHQQRAYGAMRYDPKQLATDSSHLKIELNYEAGRDNSNNPRELPPLDFLSGYFTPGVNKKGYDPFIYNTGTQLAGVGSIAGNAAVAGLSTSWVNAEDYHYAWPGSPAVYYYNGVDGSQALAPMEAFNGAYGASGASIGGFPQAAPLYTTGFSNYAMATNANNPNLFPGAYAGTVTYQNKSITDPSVYNFYDKLMDGSNKQEWQRWDAFNLTADETLLNGRLAIQGVIDHQDFNEGQQGALMGYTEPFISVDMDANLIEYPSWTGLAVADPNEGRPFIASDFGSGDNSEAYTHDNYQLEVNGDLRSEDFLQKGLLTRILGHHSLTGLLGEYKLKEDARSWTEYAVDPSVTENPQLQENPTALINDRAVSWVSYLGPSLTGMSSASGLNLSNIAYTMEPTSGEVLNFNPTYTGSVASTAPYTYPGPGGGTLTQSDNPANYKGWTNYNTPILNSTNNLNQLYTAGTKSEQIIKSGAVMYQGYLWDDSIIPEMGVRRDEVSQVASNAPQDPNTGIASMNYGITGTPYSLTTDSTSWGVTVHLAKLLKQSLPYNSDLSVYYFHGNNETPKVRYGFDTNPLPAETGKTDDYGVEMDTLNGHATLRVTFFKTLDNNAEATSGAADPLGNNGYYLYLLPAWGAANAAAYGLGLEGLDTTGFTSTAASNEPMVQKAVAAWQSTIGTYFPQSFFNAYGLGINEAALTSGNFANIFNNPGTFPFPWLISNTGGGHINGQYPIITQNIESHGYELEATVRPVPNWDLTFNATKVNAFQTALGASSSAFIQKEYQFFTGPAGQLPLWGYWGSATGTSMEQYFIQNIWSAYQLQEAQSGTTQPELSQWNFKGITNYSFDRGPLKGFNLGGGFRWQSRPILGYSISEANVGGTQGWITDPTKPLYGIIEEHADAWIGYSHQLSSKIGWRLQLNVSNLGEKPHLVPVSVEPDGTFAQDRIEEGQVWQLTNTFTF